MATVVDALVVTLGLNAKGFTQGVNKAQNALKNTGAVSAQTARQMNEHGKQAAMFFSRVRNEALSLLAIFTAGMGLKNFTANTIKSAGSIGLMASNLDMSTERLQAWQRAAERAGGSAQGITTQLRQSAQEVAKFRRGMSTETLGAFFQFGGKVEDLKNGNSYLLARSRIVADLYKTDRARAALAAQLMGISEDQFDFIKTGPASISKAIAAQQKRSSVTKEESLALRGLNSRYMDLRDTFTAVGTKVVVSLIPTFERLINIAQKWADKLLENRDAIGYWIENLLDKFSEFAKEVDSAVQSLGGWKNVLIGLAALKILSMITSLKSLASAIASVTSALIKTGGRAAAAGVGTLTRLAGGLGMLLYSENLNKGEDEWLASRDAMSEHDPMSQTNPREFARKYFTERGFSRAQTSGIIANLIAESNLNPNAVGDGGKAYGIAQWHPDRQAKFKDVMRKDMQDSSLSDQLTFVVWELRNTEKSALKALEAAQTPEDAARAMVRYERPKDREGESRKRAAIARSLYANATESNFSASNAAQVARNASPMESKFGESNSKNLNTTHDHSAQININGPVTVTTQATDADGVARGLLSIKDTETIASQANVGTF